MGCATSKAGVADPADLKEQKVIAEPIAVAEPEETAPTAAPEVVETVTLLVVPEIETEKAEAEKADAAKAEDDANPLQLVTKNFSSFVTGLVEKFTPRSQEVAAPSAAPASELPATVEEEKAPAAEAATATPQPIPDGTAPAPAPAAEAFATAPAADAIVESTMTSAAPAPAAAAPAASAPAMAPAPEAVVQTV